MKAAGPVLAETVRGAGDAASPIVMLGMEQTRLMPVSVSAAAPAPSLTTSIADSGITALDGSVVVP